MNAHHRRHRLRQCATARLRAAAALLLAVLGLAAAPAALGYPLDAADETGIARLEAYTRALRGVVGGVSVAAGARQAGSFVRLRLANRDDFELPQADAALGAKLAGYLGADASHYGVALLDLSDPERPHYAEHQADRLQNPGSVGKVLVALAILQALADLYPDDVGARRRILLDTNVTADAFIRTDHHTVPFWKSGEKTVTNRLLREGDTANLWTWLDWMCSKSSNAAASVLMKQLVLLKALGRDYPVDSAAADRFFAETPKTELGRIFLDAIQSPVARGGLDLTRLRQGSFFTAEGQRRVPGTSSHATARELLRFLVRMEQGKLVDTFSSLEMKRLLYLTDRRIRYASSPALLDAAVYYKSGSLYGCKPEPGFTCGQYKGNEKNYMNSIAIVESVDRAPPLHYIAVVTSNVLRKNSAVEHQTLATRVHRLIESLHPVAGIAPAPAAAASPATGDGHAPRPAPAPRPAGR